MMKFISEHKKIIIPSVIPFILSIFNCYIYLKGDSFLFDIAPFLWRIIITGFVLYVFAFWPLMTHYYKLYARRMNRFIWAIYMLIHCYSIALAVNIGMIVFCAAIFVAVVFVKLVLGIVSLFIR